MEPPFWYYPVQQSLGASLLAQGKSEEAAAAFRAALQRAPNNGWAAAGLQRPAEARGDRGTAERGEGADAAKLVRAGRAGARPTAKTGRKQMQQHAVCGRQELFDHHVGAGEEG
jgi:predicted Zn-dependent protease